MYVCPRCCGVGCIDCERGFKESEKLPETETTQAGRDIFRAYQYLKDYSIWPNSGALDAQCCKFIQGIDLIDMYQSRYNEEKAKKEEANSKLKAKRKGR